MKFSALVAALALVTLSNVSAADPGLEFQANDSVSSVLTRLSGQLVELRLRNGEKISGKVEKTGDKLVHLSKITSQEFYEAAISLDSIAAVVVRAKK